MQDFDIALADAGFYAPDADWQCKMDISPGRYNANMVGTVRVGTQYGSATINFNVNVRRYPVQLEDVNTFRAVSGTVAFVSENDYFKSKDLFTKVWDIGPFTAPHHYVGYQEAVAAAVIAIIDQFNLQASSDPCFAAQPGVSMPDFAPFVRR